MIQWVIEFLCITQISSKHLNRFRSQAYVIYQYSGIWLLLKSDISNLLFSSHIWSVTIILAIVIDLLSYVMLSYVMLFQCHCCYCKCHAIELSYYSTVILLQCHVVALLFNCIVVFSLHCNVIAMSKVKVTKLLNQEGCLKLWYWFC